jgi:hypothetical protein
MYLQRFERWMDRMSMYHEFGVTHGLSMYSLWFIDGLSTVLQGQLLGNRQKLRRFRSVHRSTAIEPPLPDDCHVGDMGLLLNLYAPETVRLAKRTAPLLAGTLAAATFVDPSILTNQRLSDEHIMPLGDDEVAGWVAAFGTAPGRDGTCGQGRFSWRTASARPSAPCEKAPCRGRAHPPDLCCICNQPHGTTGCWHMTGLPPPMLTRLNEFKQVAARGDATPTAPPKVDPMARQSQHPPPIRTGANISALDVITDPPIEKGASMFADRKITTSVSVAYHFSISGVQ